MVTTPIVAAVPKEVPIRELKAAFKIKVPRRLQEGEMISEA